MATSFCRTGFLLYFLTCAASAQQTPPAWNLPSWAQNQWSKLAKEKSLDFSTRLNPFVWRADFDGDGLADFAVFVKSTKTGKEGIAILSRGAKASYLIGANLAFGNGGDDFSWMDMWSVEERGTVQPSYYEKPVKLRADGLLVAKSESASALIYFKAGKLIWQQQGD